MKKVGSLFLTPKKIRFLQSFFVSVQFAQSSSAVKVRIEFPRTVLGKRTAKELFDDLTEKE